MNDVDKKVFELVELQKKKNRMISLAIASILSFVLTSGAGIKVVYDFETMNPEDLDETILQLKSGEYGEYVNYMQDEYCEQLCNGDLTSDEYCDLCRHLNSPDGIVDWAKTLNDERVNEAIDLYNMAKRDRLLTTVGNTTVATIGGVATAVLANKFLDVHEGYKRGKKDFERKYKDKGYMPR